MIGNFEIKRPDLNLSANILMYADYSSITDIFLSVPGFQFNTLADFQNESVHIAAIANEYVFPIHNIIDAQSNSEEQVLHESKFNFRYEVKPGKYRFAFFVEADITYVEKLTQYHGQNLKVYFADINNNLYGFRSGNTVKTFSVDSIMVKKIEFGLPGQASLTCILVDLKDPSEINRAYIVKSSFDVADLINIECQLETTLLYDDPTTIQLTILDPNSNGIEGLLLSNFQMTDEVNGLITLDNFTEVGNGIYTATASVKIYKGLTKMISSLYHAKDYYDFGGVVIIPQYNPSQYNNTQYKIS